MRVAIEFARYVTVACAAALLWGCVPSEAERDEEIRAFVRSLHEGTTAWKRYVPPDKREAVLATKSAITADLEILGWDHATVCCGLRNEVYEYLIRFSNGREAVSYVTVDKGRITQITLDLYEIESAPAAIH